MTHFSRKALEMMRKFFPKIFAVPDDSDLAPVVAPQNTRKYIRADELPDEIRGAYVFWRTDAAGVQWLQHVSEQQGVPEIHGFSPVDDDGDGDELDERTWTAHQILRNARLRNAERALRARQSAFPTDGVFEIDDDSADFNDEN